jgi:hypothetical protein
MEAWDQSLDMRPATLAVRMPRVVGASRDMDQDLALANLEAMTREDLRSLCEWCGLSTNGTKAVLIGTLEAARRGARLAALPPQ